MSIVSKIKEKFNVKDSFGNRHKIKLKREFELEKEEDKQKALGEMNQRAEAVKLLLLNPNHEDYFAYFDSAIELFEIQRDNLDPVDPAYGKRIFALTELIKFIKNVISEPEKAARYIESQDF